MALPAEDAGFPRNSSKLKSKPRDREDTMEERRRKKTKHEDVIDLTEEDDGNQKPQAEPSITSKSSEPSSFSVGTYNVWFGPPHPFDRMQAIASVLATDMPLFVGLQELTLELSPMLIPLLESLGYQVISQDLSDIGYGCAVAVKQDACRVISSGFLPFSETVMGRGVVWVLAKLNGVGREVLFTTSHLESFQRNYPSPGTTYTGVQQRESQAKELKEFCQDCLNQRPSVDMAVITGDLNWDDQRIRKSTNVDKPLLSILGDRWCDAWLDACPGQYGYTYDAKESAMLRGNLRRRFDRCILLRRKPEELLIEEAKLVGKDPIPGLEWRKAPHPMARSRTVTVVPVLPSDHFGLIVAIQSRKNS